MLEVIRVDINNLDLLWDDVSKVIDNQRMLNNWDTLDSIYTRLKSNGADLWITKSLGSALIGATYRRADGTNTYIVEMMASKEGSNEGWDETIKPIEKQAKEWGCKTIQVKGRKGWQKVLKEYTPIQTTLERSL